MVFSLGYRINLRVLVAFVSTVAIGAKQMFLHVINGVWLGTKGIMLLLLLVIAAAAGFGWWWGHKRAETYTNRKNLLLYGIPDLPAHKNTLHRLGDIWNFLFANRH